MLCSEQNLHQLKISECVSLSVRVCVCSVSVCVVNKNLRDSEISEFVVGLCPCLCVAFYVIPEWRFANPRMAMAGGAMGMDS